MTQRAPADSMSDIAPRVRHLEVEVGGLRDDQKLVFSKLDAISVAIAGLQAGRPALGAMDAVRTGLALVQGLVLLITATVGGIIYVSSNANNADLALMKYQIRELTDRSGALERNAGWAPRVTRAPD